MESLNTSFLSFWLKKIIHWKGGLLYRTFKFVIYVCFSYWWTLAGPKVLKIQRSKTSELEDLPDLLMEGREGREIVYLWPFFFASGIFGHDWNETELKNVCRSNLQLCRHSEQSVDRSKLVRTEFSLFILTQITGMIL